MLPVSKLFNIIQQTPAAFLAATGLFPQDAGGIN